jgi:CHASE2 domain-containing sensor protein
VLDRLPDADVTFLVEPDRHKLTEFLWDDRGWDILFFAGHSSSQADGTTGQIAVNPQENLTVAQLQNALKKAIARGLKIAIFNSCDGLGLARELADLHVPQMLVMREPVPDRVAQAFLKSFLTTFARGNTFYLSVREAREKLQALEDRFPCATWLPTICQNPAVKPPTWQELSGKIGIDEIHPDRPQPLQVDRSLGWRPAAIASTLVTAVVLGIRFLGILQPWELAAFDLSLQLRPAEPPDPRILIVTITEADVQAQDPTQRRGSLSDATLEKLLEKLETWKPRAIGLDIYRDYPVQKDLPNLAKYLQQSDRLIVTCKISDRESDNPGIAPPPEVPMERLGFSDFITDADGRVRRHLLSLTPEPTSPCLTPYAFNVQLAFRYLATEGIVPQWTPDGNLQFGKVVLQRLTPRSGGYQGIDAGGNQVLLNYRASKRVATEVTLGEVLRGEVNPVSVRDRLVSIGTTAESFGDYWPTPYSRGRASDGHMSGVTLQAHMVSQILSAVLDDRPLLRTMPPWSDTLWIWGWSVVGSTIVWRFRSNVTLGGALGIASIALGGSCWLGLTYLSLWLPWVSSSIALLTTGGSLLIYSRTKQK